MAQHVCPECGDFNMKLITSKKTGKKYWVCQAPEEVCRAIFPDDGGKPDFPQENPEALAALEWLAAEERQKSLNEWEREFVAGLIEKVEQQIATPHQFTQKQIGALRKLADRFANAPKF